MITLFMRWPWGLPPLAPYRIEPAARTFRLRLRAVPSDVAPMPLSKRSF